MGLVVASPPTTAEQPWLRKPSDPAALVFQARVKAIDYAARALITVSGIGIIAAVLGIGLFLFSEVAPLFRGARVWPGIQRRVLDAGDAGLLVILDEHQEKAIVIGNKPVARLTFLDKSAAIQDILLPGLEGQRVTAASRLLQDKTLALGTEQGQAWVGTVGLSTVFEGEKRLVQPTVETQFQLEASPGYTIDRIAYRSAGGRSLVAMIVDGGHLLIARIAVQRPLAGPVKRSQETMALPVEERFGKPVAVLINEPLTQVLAGTTKGWLLRWRLSQTGEAERIEERRVIANGGLSAMSYLVGERSIAVGGSDGSVATWSPINDESMPDGKRFARIHAFPEHDSAVSVITPSPRDKGFFTASADGRARLHFMTSERTLSDIAIGGSPVAGDFAPKANGAAWIDQAGVLRHWRVDNPHPEISWRALFGKIWYEGYEKPEYVWQSTGGTDDFESKLSLVPLVFGTLKGTFYALAFAVPLALFGALYCSQFLDKRLRNPIKSAVELMAALPSVVLGFVTGLVLAPLVQYHVVAVLILPLVVSFVAVFGMFGTRMCLKARAKSLALRHEFWVLTAWVIAGCAAAWMLGPWVEKAVFQGDFEAWLLKATGTRYDQRNSLIIGWAMGFAVIPIIFTICEDAFSSVPKHLVGASLACGASSWQTAWRVILPAAGSGVFSAVMVGFGRAIGETMIVLMATGNTPIMDWTLFNGFRALSANIAVEISEAPQGGTLYRVLFIAALLLFSMTFVVNTAAELIRLRLRRSLQGL